MRLDLFKLHSKEDKPKSWIWINFNPKELRKEYFKLLKFKSQNEIGKIINNSLNAGFSTTIKHLIRLKKDDNSELPLPIAIELVKLINKPNLKIKVINSINYFICKSSTTKQKVKAVKYVDKTFAKLIGAFLADGHSRPEGNTYRLTVSDGRKDLIVKYTKWIKEIFEFNGIIRYSKEDNVYNCWFNNKIIGRYLKNIFEIPTGKKAYIIKEPNLIKDSSFNIRKAFASGFISFDGGIKATGMVSISSMSKDLINNLYEILRLDGININKLYNLKKKSWLLESNSGRNPLQIKKLLSYFEKGTWKYERLKFFLNERKYSLADLNYLFPKHYLAKISLNEIYNSINYIKSGKIVDISKRLNKQFKVADTTIYKYLYILEQANLIYKTTEKNSDGKNFWSETIYNIAQ